MATVDMPGVKAALAAFMDQRVQANIASNDSFAKWAIGGASGLVISRLDKIVKANEPALRAVGIINENGHLDIDAAENFIHGGFEKQSEITLGLITFNEQDGEALIKLLRQQGGEK